MLISYSKKFIFVHVFKTAGTSVTKALEPYCYKPQSLRPRNWTTLLTTPRNHLLRRKMHKHASAKEIRQELGPIVYDAFFKFSFVRNPWDWLVSLYHYILENPANEGYVNTTAMGSFSAFVRSRTLATKTQTSFLVDSHGALIVDFVGRFENLEQDFRSINERLSLGVDLPHINRSQRNAYRDYYDDETRELTARIYAEDIERFGYTF